MSVNHRDGMFPQSISTTIILLVSVSLTGCVRREGRNSDCKWPGEPEAKTLYANRPGDAEHLRGDMEFAEDLAVRYMDAHRFGFSSQQDAAEALNACLGALVEQIGKSHNIPPSEVRNFFGRRSFVVDASVSLSFLALYSFVAGTFVVRLLRRYPPEDGWIATFVVVTLSSLAFGICGMMIGEVWSGTVESIRIGTGHLSYRVNHVPWVRHEVGFFVVCVVLFWCAAIARYRIRHRCDHRLSGENPNERGRVQSLMNFR